MCLWGRLVNHSITRGQRVASELRLVDVASCQPDITVCTAVYSEVSSLCQTPSDSEGEVAYNS